MLYTIKFDIFKENYSSSNKTNDVRKVIKNQLRLIEGEINKSDCKSIQDMIDIIPFSMIDQKDEDIFFKYNDYVKIKLNIKKIIRSEKLNELING
jgi:hypothetical protein